MGRQNSEGLPRLSVLNDNRIGTSYIDLAKEEADQPTTTITPAQTTFLIHAINKLGRLEGGESSRKPLKIATSPPSRKAQESIDLKSLKAKLQDGSYPSVKAFQDAFKEMIQAATLPDSEHPITKHASKLNCAFRGYMVECPGSKGRPAAPKKRAAASPAKPSRAPQRANAASHPRAAKAAMQNRKYIRDHY